MSRDYLNIPALTESRQQFVELRQQLGNLQLQVVHLQEGLLANQFDHSSRRRILNETAAISQAVPAAFAPEVSRPARQPPRSARADGYGVQVLLPER